MLPLQVRISHAIRKSQWLLNITHQNKLICLAKEKYFQIQKGNNIKRLQKFGYEALIKIFQVSEKLEFPLWIDWGTLLGYVREGALISYDDDLDIGTYCMTLSVHKCFVKEMEQKGFKRIREFKDGNLLIAECFEYKGIFVDVDYYFENGDFVSWYMFEVSEETKILHVGAQEQMVGMEIYRYDFLPVVIKKGKFKNGTPCNIPVEAEKHVVEMYGQGWEKPEKACDWHEINNYTYEGFRDRFIGWRLK